MFNTVIAFTVFSSNFCSHATFLLFASKDFGNSVTTAAKFRFPLRLLIVHLGYAADGIAKLTGRNLPVSSIRVKKFASSAEFRSAKNDLDNFDAPFDLSEGLTHTLKSEFISPDRQKEIFYTE